MKNIFKKIFSIKVESKRLHLSFLFFKFSIKKRERKLKKKILLICRFDGIGDYVIMRKFLKNIRYSEKYKNYKIIFAGRNEFSEFAERHDKDYIDEFIWINYLKFMECKKYRKQCLKLFSKLRVDDVISPVYDREAYVCEKVIQAFKHAKNIIGHYGQINRLSMVLNDKQIKRVNKKYTRFIETGNTVLFEEERYKIFFEKVLNENIEDSVENFQLPINLKSDYVLVAPFAGDPIRTWNRRNFSKVIDYITQNLNYEVGILGNSLEFESVENIISDCIQKNRIKNLAGKVSLADINIYLANCKFLLANETGTVHIANLVKTKTFCISNGSYMGRFQPCSKEDFITYIYPNNIETYLKEHNEYGIVSTCSIQEIKPSKVIKIIEEKLKKLN